MERKKTEGMVMLRKMTKKSTIQEGKYALMKVGDLMKDEQHMIYLARIYYKYSNLSFVDEVLEELQITGDLRIDKPSADMSKFYEWRKKFLDTDEKRLRNHFHKLKNNKVYYTTRSINNLKSMKPSLLRDNNQFTPKKK